MKRVAIKTKPAAAKRRQAIRNAFGRLEVIIVNAALKGPNVRMAVAAEQITIPSMASALLNGQCRAATQAVTIKTKPVANKKPQVIHNTFERLVVILVNAA